MAHIHEKIDFTVSIYIVFENKVLLHVHKKLGLWLPPGGHIELDEDPNQAALREAKEESALDVELVGEGRRYDTPFDSQDLIPPRFLSKHFYDKTHTHQHVDLVYFARSQDGDAHGEEGGEVKWFTREELQNGDY